MRWQIEQNIDALVDAEVGTIFKDAPVRVSLVYPSPYNVGMSSLGFQTIYRLLNARPDVVCERAFLPDDPELHRRHRVPLLTFESKRPVDEADVVAFSVAYETEIIGLLECLELSGIPARSAERGDGWPLVLFGGPLTNSNPLPVAPFADVIVMGEGEELVEVVVDWWKNSATRSQFLRDIAALPGVYVPSIHGEVLRPIAQIRDDLLPAYSQIITPNTELANMHLVENARGCHRGCTFCVMRRTTNMGMRAVSAERVLATIPEHATRVGLVGAATSDHPQILTIMREIIDSGRELGLSSLRADRMTPEFIAELKRGGARTLTIGVDGTSARMRKLAQKGIKDAQIVRCAEFVRDFDLKLLKLYMVFGYPEETMDDIEELIDFVGELSQICNIALGLSPLVSKKNTPLDGIAFQDEKFLEAKVKRINEALGKRMDIRSTSVRWAWIEHALAQGGWEMADAAEMAWKEGGSFGAWKRAIKRYRKDTTILARPTSDRLQAGALLGTVSPIPPSADPESTLTPS